MSTIFDHTTSWVRDIFRYQTIQHVISNPYFWAPIGISTANAVDCFLVSKESQSATDNKKEKGLQVDITARVISLVTVDVPMLCLGSLVTFYRGQSQNILSTMINTKDVVLIESLSRELAVVSGNLGKSREAMKAVLLASAVTNLWFSLINWYKGRNGWFRANLRKLTIGGNVLLFYLLSKPLDVQIQ
jgi:hypothetical protein